MLAGIREIAIVTTIHDQAAFMRLLGDGQNLGIQIEYVVQDSPNGIAEAFLICQNFINSSPVALVLGDNIFHGQGVGRNLSVYTEINGAHIFAYQVNNPKDFGVVVLDGDLEPTEIQEKPTNSKSNLAVPGLYFYDSNVVEIAKTLERSARGELEITALNMVYLRNQNLKVSVLPRGTAWFDGGTVNSLFDASTYVRSIEERQGQKIGCIEEVAWRNGWIDDKKLISIAEKYKNNEYGEYLSYILQNDKV